MFCCSAIGIDECRSFENLAQMYGYLEHVLSVRLTLGKIELIPMTFSTTMMHPMPHDKLHMMALGGAVTNKRYKTCVVSNVLSEKVMIFLYWLTYLHIASQEP